MPNLIWFRRDLRLRDNPALFEACKQAHDGVLGLFVFTPKTWLRHGMGTKQISFLTENVQLLSQELFEHNIPLLIRETPYFKDIPELLANLVRKINIQTVYFNRQYEWDEYRRDQAVIETLQQLGCQVVQSDDQVIISPEHILNQQQQPFKVYTPFKRKWIALLPHYNLTPLPKPQQQITLPIARDSIPTHFNCSTYINWLKPGEKSAIQRLRNFCQMPIADYQNSRDFPALDTTSRLSPYLAIGVLSIKQCIARAMLEQSISTTSNLLDKTSPAVWISELIWREFYKTISFHFPDICKHHAFQRATEQLEWNTDTDLFSRWCQGLTGFPLVDAAMRQLNQTGWMHNRLRMLSAMFLSKILHIDWRWGERYFSEQLIDADFSANNGGWQWCASTGTDAVPYFRIFNPITQSQRFDKDGSFIRQFCPELTHLDAKTIHDPFTFGIKSSVLNYPQKIVDYTKMRERTLAAFKALVRV